jgi:multidrug efflux system membrane fusion protein
VNHPNRPFCDQLSVQNDVLAVTISHLFSTTYSENLRENIMSLPLSIRTALMTTVVMLSACHHSEPEKPTPRPAIVAQPGTADVLLNSYSGEVTARFQPQLSFRVDGKIIKRLVDVGDTVKQGQALAQLDPQDAQLQLNAAKAQLASAESAERIAKAELARYKLLLAPNAISRSQYDQVENRYKAAESALTQAKSQLSLATNQIEYTILRAPQNGKIVQRQVEAGQVVTAGQAAYTLATQGDREVLIGIPEQDESHFHVGQAVTVTVWSQPNARFPAHVREISPAADTSRTFATRIAFDELDPAVDIGQSARVFTNDVASRSLLSLPLSAITAEQGAAYVWVVNTTTSHLKRTQIQVGVYGRNTATISAGIQPTDWVVIAGVQLLHDGQQIQAVDRQNRAIDFTPSSKNPQPVPHLTKQG